MDIHNNSEFHLVKHRYMVDTLFTDRYKDWFDSKIIWNFHKKKAAFLTKKCILMYQGRKPSLLKCNWHRCIWIETTILNVPFIPKLNMHWKNNKWLELAITFKIYLIIILCSIKQFRTHFLFTRCKNWFKQKVIKTTIE